MNTRLATTLLIIGAFIVPSLSFAEDSDSDRSNPKAFVKDSVITTKIKTKLAAEHLSSLAHIQVDTDANGAVWLTGDARSQEDIDKAVSIAKNTEGVASVTNKLKIKKDD